MNSLKILLPTEAFSVSHLQAIQKNCDNKLSDALNQLKELEVENLNKDKDLIDTEIENINNEINDSKISGTQQLKNSKLQIDKLKKDKLALESDVEKQIVKLKVSDEVSDQINDDIENMYIPTTMKHPKANIIFMMLIKMNLILNHRKILLMK